MKRPGDVNRFVMTVLVLVLGAQVAFLEWRDGLVSLDLLGMNEELLPTHLSRLTDPADGAVRAIFLVDSNCEASNTFAEQWATEPIPGVEPTWVSLNPPWGLEEWRARHPRIEPIGLRPRTSRRVNVVYLPAMIFLDERDQVIATLPANRTLLALALETSPLVAQEELFRSAHP
jgi:hypothetical protein